MVYVCTQTEEGAKFASLDYEIIGEAGGLSLAQIKLHTGRTHQIRVQMAAINAPVYGDMRYGGENAVTGEKLRYIAEPPLSEKPWKFFRLDLKA